MVWVRTLRMDDSEQSLLKRLLAGDESAFETLVGAYHDRLIRLARTYVRTEALAADVVQETWLAVLRGLPRFEGRSSLRTWIFHVLANRARTHAVREGRFVPFTELSSADATEPDGPGGDWFLESGAWREPPAPWSSTNPESMALNEELQRALDAAVDALPESQRAVLVLRDMEGLSPGEACNILDLSETNQRVLLHRARTKVRRALGSLLERRR